MLDEKNLNDENEELMAEYENNDGYYDNYANNALNKNTNVIKILNFYFFFRISELEIRMRIINFQKLSWMLERIWSQKMRNKRNLIMDQIFNF